MLRPFAARTASAAVNAVMVQVQRAESATSSHRLCLPVPAAQSWFVVSNLLSGRKKALLKTRNALCLFKCIRGGTFRPAQRGTKRTGIRKASLLPENAPYAHLCRSRSRPTQPLCSGKNPGPDGRPREISHDIIITQKTGLSTPELVLPAFSDSPFPN